MQSAPYSIATDGSTDYGDIKLYPIVVKYYDQSVGRIVTVLLCMPECSETSTGEHIFELMDNELTKRDIPWDNCLSFGADNASVMQGLGKGLAGFIKRKNSAIYMLGCPCHLIHLAAEKAASQLPVSVEDLLVDVFYYLDKSSKRKQELKHFQELYGVEMRKIVKHVSTRWLSLGKCIERLLQQWPALTNYFQEEKAKLEKKRSSVKANTAIVGPTSSGIGKTSHTSSATVTRHKEKTDHGSKTTQRRGDKTHTGKDSTVAAHRHSSNTATAGPSSSGIGKTSHTSSATVTRHKEKTDHGSKNTHRTVGKKHTEEDSTVRQFDLSAYLWRQQQRGKAQTDSAKKKDKSISDSCCTATFQKSLPATRVYRACKNLESLDFHLYCFFLDAVIPVFDTINILLQKDEPCVHLMHSTLVNQLKSILNMFVKPDVMNAVHDITKVVYQSPQNQKDDNNLFVGHKSKRFIADHSDQVELPTFYSSVRRYYMKTVEYMLKKFPYQDLVISHAAVADISGRGAAQFASVEYFTTLFPCLAVSDASMDKLEMEFINYQTDVLPSSVTTCDRADTAWHLMAQVKDANGQAKFAELSKVMLAVVCIFHSNADCERVFSLVTKNKTAFRPSMITRTLNSLVTHKQFMIAKHTVCYQQTYSKKTLQKVKSATYIQLTSKK